MMTGGRHGQRFSMTRLIVAILIAGSAMMGNLSPVIVLSRMAEASASWVSSTASDFNASGGSFYNCSVRDVGGGAEIRLDSGWGWLDMTPQCTPSGRSRFCLAAIGNSSRLRGNRSPDFLYPPHVFADSAH